MYVSSPAWQPRRAIRCPRRNSSLSARESSCGVPLPAPAIRLSVGHTEIVVLRVWGFTTLGLVLVAAAAVVAALLAWPTVGIAGSTSGLAAVSLPGFSGHVETVSVTSADGKSLPVSLRSHVVWPRVRLAAGEHVTLTVVVRRPSWVGGLGGPVGAGTRTATTRVARVRAT